MLTLIGMGIGYLILLGYMLQSRNTAFTPEKMASPEPTRVLIELWDAYEQARVVAQQQAEDAQLVSASTQWQGAEERALLEGAGDWAFVFYSPARGVSLDVVVSAGAARIVNQTRVWNDPNTMAEGAWQTGPRDAMLIFLARGGRAFLDEHPQAVVNLRLSENEQGDAVWDVVALALASEEHNRRLFSMQVNAKTNHVVRSD